MQNSLLEGYYAFPDYAILHGNHHLETAIHFLEPDDLCPSADLGIAINEFFEMNDLGRIEKTEARKDYVQRCNGRESTDCFESLVLLHSHAKASRLAEDEPEFLGPLDVRIARVRVALKELSISIAGDQISNTVPKQNPKDFYGDKWYKCSRHLCDYFREGSANKVCCNTIINTRSRFAAPR